MSHNPEQRETGDIARSFFLQAVGLFAVMLLPYAVLEGAQAPLATVAILFGYVLLGMFLTVRGENKDKGQRVTYRTGFVAILYMGSGFLAVSGIGSAIVVAWLGLAYKPVESEELPVAITGDAILAGLPHALTMLAGSVVLLALSIVLLHWGHGGLGALAARLRRHGPGLFLSPWLSETAVVMLLFGVSVFLGMAIPLDMLIEAMSPGQTTTFLNLAKIFPFLPLCMLLTAVIAVAVVNFAGYGTFGAVVRALQEDDPEPAPRDAWWPVLATITLSGSAGSVAVALWALHVGITAATASVWALQAGMEVGDAVKYWAIEERAAGRPQDELAALVNTKGYWTKAKPGEGLPEFLPGLDEVIAGFELERECRIQVAAAPAKAGDGAISMPASPYADQPARPDGGKIEAPGRDEEAGVALYGQALPLRYCVKVTCPVPVTWEAPPAVSLYSSHPTGRPDWLYWVYFDLYTEGVAREPGGYCTADGGLAAEYQG